jgi:hypothetical protein
MIKSITSILAVVALGSAFAVADDKPAAPASGDGKPTTTAPAATPDATAAKPKPDFEAQFKKLDTNGDGKVSKEEFLASKHAQKDPAKAEAQFKKLDKDGDGFLTLEEFSTRGGHKKADASASSTEATPAAKTDAK